METDAMQHCGSTGFRCKTASKAKSASQFGRNDENRMPEKG